MLEKLVNAIVDLLKIKSLITLSVVTVFCVMILRQIEISKPLETLLLIIVSFYFGTQNAKKSGDTL